MCESDGILIALMGFIMSLHRGHGRGSADCAERERTEREETTSALDCIIHKRRLGGTHLACLCPLPRLRPHTYNTPQSQIFYNYTLQMPIK